ncbi:RHS repeat domain-containing protein [Micromonospora maritima]|uniref:RHS repeat domain-containing protein n=1 Tax=Micromonospora maritima TaxID=986711 RepID=UPI00157BC967|nr:RHS repeat-associated core domain-containing protein [Micromonospora maritima]
MSVAPVEDPGAEVAAARGSEEPLQAVTVRVHDRSRSKRAGIDGLLLEVNRADSVRRPARAAVAVDYRSVAAAFGGDWAARARLVALPECALTTPQLAGCTTATPLVSRRDFQDGTVSAVAPVGAADRSSIIALAAGDSGDNGDYTATSLSPSSTWEVSAQTGAFAWSYPLRVVPGVGGPEPSLSLSYNSQSIDGRTAGTNNQGSWIGDGWEMWPGYVERTYQGCADDTDDVDGKAPNNKTKKTGDQCWWRNNATLSLNGGSTELVDAGNGRWKGVSDDGSKVELLKDTSLGNGDNDGEYWRVTTPDGTQYYFGRHHGMGGASAGTATESVWTTQVYGNHPGESGYVANDFAASRETQAWRWNLDYVVDPHGNTMTLFYTKETGAYGRESDATKRTTYDRGGYLTRIEYGNRADAPSTTYASARVMFDVADRCKAGATCYDSNGRAVPSAWPDTPWDRYCHASPCTDKLNPIYFTQKRLAKIRAQVHTSGGAYVDVESWALRHEYLDAGYPYGEGIPMYLRGLTRTGHVTTAGGSAASDPEIVFDPGADPLPNRVDGPDDGKTALFRWRVRTITTETGAQVVVTFKPLDCVRSALPTPSTNTKRCMPQYYSNDGTTPVLDWFHKYVVDFVDTNDNTGAGEAQKVYYDYLDDPAWHFDDSELVKEKKRTWGQFRGYGHVKVRKGLATGTQLTTEYRYLRGMDGDRQASGTRDVWVEDSFGGRVEDHDAYAGQLLEETTLNGATGPWVSGSINTPTTPVQTASANSLRAYMVNTAKVRTYSRTTSEADGVRWTQTATKYNSDNLPYEVNDLGDENTAADDTCTRTWYARNGTVWMLDKVKRTQQVGVACTATVSLPGDLLSESRTTFDRVNNDWDTDLPVRGLPVKSEEVSGWQGGSPVWSTITTSGYDANGRVKFGTDALNHTTTTEYVPETAGPVTSTTVTNPKGHKTVTTFATAWNMPSQTVDPNGAKTALAYDGLGRLVKVWLPGRDRATQTSNLEFSYLVRNTKPTAVTTRKMLPTGTGYKTSVTLYDGWLRERQTQTQAPGGGRAVTDVYYDSRGLKWWTTHPHYDTTNAAVSTELLGPAGREVAPSLTEYLYDGAGRPTAEIFKVQGIGGEEKWRTSTAYQGDLTTVTPPKGGTKTASLVDAQGRTVELRQFKDATTFDTTRYTYSDRGELTNIRDAAGNEWKYAYDQRGHKVRDEDPDKGVSQTEYNLSGQITKVTDQRGRILVTTYDELGRKSTLRDGSETGPVRAQWTYDTLTNGIGKLTSSVRFDNGRQYTNEVTGYDVAGRPSGTRVTIPSTEGALCASTAADPCSYTFSSQYKPDGQIASTILPAVRNDLAAEQMLFNYNDVGAPTTFVSGLGIYVYSVGYDKVGKLVERTLGAFGKRVQINYTIEHGTNRLRNTKVSPEGTSVPADISYDYDDAGNLTRVHDAPYGQSTDTQCFTYDHLRRLKEAWTPGAGDCGDVTRSVTGLGGPAPYWHSYEYNDAAGQTGSRSREILHAAGGDTVRTYRYPAQGGVAGSGPHELRDVTTDRPVGADQVDTYQYDESGNTTVRNLAGTSQNLTWDNEGRLSSAQTGSRTVSYLYDAEGNRLIRRDPQGGGSTLYLPNGMEVKVAAGSTAATCTRYYTHLDQQIAVRTKAGGLTWFVTDQHNTAELSLKATDLLVQRRRTLPFGEVRGSAPTAWAGDRGFVGGTIDPTGLTHLGAREYDPSTGRFISVDPIIDTSDPQQMHGYAYGNNAPPSFSDPSGLLFSGLWNKAKGAVSSAVDTVVDDVSAAAKSVVDSYQEDPWKFVAQVAVGVAVGVGVAALCGATAGVGCAVTAAVVGGALAGGASAATGHAVDAAQGEGFDIDEFNTDVTNGMIGGAVVGGLFAPLAGASAAASRPAIDAVALPAAPRAAAATTASAGPGSAVRPVGAQLESVEDIMVNPYLLYDMAPAQVEAIVKGSPGWQIEKLGKGSHKGQGWMFREYAVKRGKQFTTGRMIQWHPGGGHHGKLPYWKVKQPNKPEARLPQHREKLPQWKLDQLK